ncbi:MAG: GNAT family N-acetyltransferase [Alphaproteobacteria bacterium]|nr:GNAT family N-acetyltransferase [Alphaproteobacteria bacterium]MDE2336923.1 GNAT family N-acetyltransferase [Alphaproteobacteria bacterium]
MPPRLADPDIRYRDGFVAALREGLHLEPAAEEDIRLAETDFGGWLAKRNDLTRAVVLPDGRQVRKVPQRDFWLVAEENFLGVVSFRPQLNDHLMKRGGNIGYAVRASARRKGYGRLMLGLMLDYARKAGLEKVLITCHDENAGSIKIIEGAGGVLQDKVNIAGLALPERRYWIAL